MTPFAQLEKSAARGDQALKVLKALSTRAAHGTTPSRASAMSVLDIAAGYPSQKIEPFQQGRTGMRELVSLLRSKRMRGRLPSNLVGSIFGKNPVNASYADEMAERMTGTGSSGGSRAEGSIRQISNTLNGMREALKSPNI